MNEPQNTSLTRQVAVATGTALIVLVTTPIWIIVGLAARESMIVDEQVRQPPIGTYEIEGDAWDDSIGPDDTQVSAELPVDGFGVEEQDLENEDAPPFIEELVVKYVWWLAMALRPTTLATLLIVNGVLAYFVRIRRRWMGAALQSALSAPFVVTLASL